LFSLAEYAIARGYRVIGIDSGEDKRALIKGYGVNDFIDYQTEDIVKRVQDLTGGMGAHAAIIVASGAKAYEQGVFLSLLFLSLPLTYKHELTRPPFPVSPSSRLPPTSWRFDRSRTSAQGCHRCTSKASSAYSLLPSRTSQLTSPFPSPIFLSGRRLLHRL
jgi:hypothetical protein